MTYKGNAEAYFTAEQLLWLASMGISQLGDTGKQMGYPGNSGQESTEGIGTPHEINGTSYDINKLYKTQPDSYNELGSVNNMKEAIQAGGPEAVPPITVYVHNGQALIVDGHNRLEAFLELGYSRVPIKYIHENQIENFGRTLDDLLAGMFK